MLKNPNLRSKNSKIAIFDPNRKLKNTNTLYNNDNTNRAISPKLGESISLTNQVKDVLTEPDLTKKVEKTRSDNILRKVQTQTLEQSTHVNILAGSGSVSLMSPNFNAPSHVLYHNETLSLMHSRWSKLYKDFKSKSGQFDISKVPDIYDCIKYDRDHNNSHLKLKNIDKLYYLAQAMADCIISQEYGITVKEKIDIALGYCVPLLKKIKCDLQHTSEDSSFRLDPTKLKGKVLASPGRHVRTRLYFTSESHIHSLLNVLRFGELATLNDDQWKRATQHISTIKELNYLTQIIIMLYEDPNEPLESEKRYHVELHFSPGEKTHRECDKQDLKNKPKESILLNKPAPKSNVLELSPKVDKFLKTAVLHNSAPPLTESGTKFSVGFTADGQEILNSSPNKELSRISSDDFSRSLSQARTRSDIEIGGLGTGPQCPLFSQKVINGLSSTLTRPRPRTSQPNSPTGSPGLIRRNSYSNLLNNPPNTLSSQLAACGITPKPTPATSMVEVGK